MAAFGSGICLRPVASSLLFSLHGVVAEGFEGSGDFD